MVGAMTEQEETPQSYIVVGFAALGSALFTIQLVNVTAGQVLMAASALEVKGKNGFIVEENARLEREAERNIARPAQGIITAKR